MKRKFLIVDEDKEITEGLTTFFNKYSIEGHQASSASEAKQLMLNNDYDLVILEMILPCESGTELTQWIKSKLDIPLVLLTSLCGSIDTYRLVRGKRV